MGSSRQQYGQIMAIGLRLEIITIIDLFAKISVLSSLPKKLILAAYCPHGQHIFRLFFVTHLLKRFGLAYMQKLVLIEAISIYDKYQWIFGDGKYLLLASGQGDLK